MIDDEPNQRGFAEPHRRRSRLLPAVLLVLLVLAGAAGLWLARESGWLDGGPGAQSAAMASPAAVPAAMHDLAIPADPGQQAALGVRLAALEQRIARLDSQSHTVAENAARAEGLMIAFATRRAIERNLPLGYLEQQLKLRFGDGQPNAVATLIGASADPVTLDQLSASLAALRPAFTHTPTEDGAWRRLEHELANLFVIRKASAPSPAPTRRLERAQNLLQAGRVDAAIAEVQRLPGRAAASSWIDAASRYVTLQRALDLIETAALLEPHQQPRRSAAPAIAQPASPPVSPPAAPVAAPAPASTETAGAGAGP